MYYCSDCKASTTERLLDINGQQQKTNDFLKAMIGSLKETVTYSAIARMYKVSISNVIRHFDKLKLQEKQVNPRKVRNLAIDEVKFIKLKNAKYQCVLIYSDTHKIIAILKTRQQKFVKEYMFNTFESLDTITQDLWSPYRSIARSCFPKAKVIADPFHVVRQFMWAFSRTRIALAKQQGVKTNKNWKILTKRYSKLDKKGKEKVTNLLNENPQLKAAHMAKELALEMLSCKNKVLYLELLSLFKEFIDENKLVEFEVAYKSVMNWHNEILNMFDYSYSNGAIERVNRVIKQSKNIAFGFLNLSRATKLIQYRVN
jgi:transposase